MVKIESLFLRGRCAIALAACGSDRKALLARARRDARRLQRLGLAHAQGLACMLEAGIAGVEEDVEQAAAWLRRCEEPCRDAAMASNAALARRQLGLVLGGDDGAALAASATAQLAGEGIVDLERFARVFLPGFTDSRDGGAAGRGGGWR